MNKIRMKIMGYEEDSQSILVSFASDTTKHKDPSEYPQHAFQPLNMWPGVTDIEELKKRIAVAGIYLTNQQTIKESFVADPTKINSLKQMVGQQFEYTENELTSENVQTPIQVV